MTDAQDPGMAEAIRKIDRVIRLRKGDLDVAKGEMAATQDHLTALVDQAARLRLVIDALISVRLSLAPMPEADAPTPPPSPLDVTCPTCGADYGKPCQDASGAKLGSHLTRHEAARVKAVDRA